MNTIQPVQQIVSPEQTGGTSKPASSAIPFQSLFQDAVTNAEQASANLDGEVAKVATGQSDDLHNALIASQKASLSIGMVVELRNKLLDAYKEIININV